MSKTIGEDMQEFAELLANHHALKPRLPAPEVQAAVNEMLNLFNKHKGE